MAVDNAQTETEKPLQTDWGSFGVKLEVPASNFDPSKAHNNPNPCVRRYGFQGNDPATPARCKTCVKLIAKLWDKTYYKCELRGDTNGTGTDHRVNWTACGKYELDPEKVKPKSSAKRQKKQTISSSSEEESIGSNEEWVSRLRAR